LAIFKAQFELDPENQHKTANNGNGQTNQINQGINPVFEDIP